MLFDISSWGFRVLMTIWKDPLSCWFFLSWYSTAPFCSDSSAERKRMFLRCVAAAQKPLKEHRLYSTDLIYLRRFWVSSMASEFKHRDDADGQLFIEMLLERTVKYLVQSVNTNKRLLQWSQHKYLRRLNKNKWDPPVYKSLEHTKRKSLLKKHKPTHQLEGATTTEVQHSVLSTTCLYSNCQI